MTATWNIVIIYSINDGYMEHSNNFQSLFWGSLIELRTLHVLVFFENHVITILFCFSFDFYKKEISLYGLIMLISFLFLA